MLLHTQHQALRDGAAVLTRNGLFQDGLGIVKPRLFLGLQVYGQ